MSNKDNSTYEWRKTALAGFKANVTRLTVQREGINAEIDQQLRLITALGSVELKRPYNGGKGKDAAGRRKPTGDKAIPWQKRPGNEKKAEAWKRKMAKAKKGKKG